MTDMTSMTPVTRAKPAKTEFMVYFAIIFAATLPLATLTWALAAIKSGSIVDALRGLSDGLARLLP